jgi:hypothetical protein
MGEAQAPELAKPQELANPKAANSTQNPMGLKGPLFYLCKMSRTTQHGSLN